MLFWMSLIAIVVLATLAGIACWYVRDELLGIGSLIGLAWCWFSAIRWRLRFGLRSMFAQTAAGFLLAGSFYVFLELGLTSFTFFETWCDGSGSPGRPYTCGLFVKIMAANADRPPFSAAISARTLSTSGIQLGRYEPSGGRFNSTKKIEGMSVAFEAMCARSTGLF